MYKRKSVIFLGICLCAFVILVIGMAFNKDDVPDQMKNEEIVKNEQIQFEQVNQQSNIADNIVEISNVSSNAIEENEQANIEQGNITVYRSFVQTESINRHELIEYPTIDIANEDDVAELINEQIYSIVIPEDFGQYYSGQGEIEIYNETEVVGDKIISIHFTGYMSKWGSYAEYNKGLNFDLRTGKIISLTDYYTLADIREIVYAAKNSGELNSSGFAVDEEIDERFLVLFDSDDYSNQTDNFFIQNNKLCFIVPPAKSMRQSSYVEIDLDNFGMLQ